MTTFSDFDRYAMARALELAARGRLSVKIQIVARDDAGNRRTREYKFTLLAPK